MLSSGDVLFKLSAKSKAAELYNTIEDKKAGVNTE